MAIPRILYNNSTGTTNTSMSSSTTSISFTSAPTWATVASPNYIPLVLDTGTNMEIVHVTAYTSGGTSATVLRGQEGTTGKAHSSGITWGVDVTAFDFGAVNSFPNNVVVYGADPTGTADSTTSIQNCINAAYANVGSYGYGGLVYFPPGNYTVTATLVLPSYTVLYGAGAELQGGVTITAKANMPAIIANTAWYTGTNSLGVSGYPDANMGVIGIQVNGNYNITSGNYKSGHGVVFYGTNDFIENCFAQYIYGDGFRITSTLNSGTATAPGGSTTLHKIKDCGTNYTTGHGISQIDSLNLMTDGWIIDCEPGLSGYGYTGSSYQDSGNLSQGIHVDVGGGWEISGNHPSGTTSHAIDVVDAVATRITNNYCDSYGQSTSAGTYWGIYVSNIATYGANDLAACTIGDNTGLAITPPTNGSTVYGGIHAASSSTAANPNGCLNVHHNIMQCQYSGSGSPTQSSGKAIEIIGGSGSALVAVPGKGTNWIDPNFTGGTTYTNTTTSSTYLG